MKYFIFVFVFILSVSFAKDPCKSLFKEKILPEAELKQKIESQKQLNPRMRDNNDSWNRQGQVISLSSTVEGKFDGSGKNSTVALYGYPFFRDGKYWIFYKTWQNSRGEYIGRTQDLVDKISMEEIYEIHRESYFKYYDTIGPKVVLIQKNNNSKEFLAAKYIRQTKKNIIVEFPDKKQKAIPKFDFFIWNVIFEGTGELNLAEIFFKYSKQVNLVLVNTPQISNDLCGIYVHLKKPLSYSRDIFRDKEVYKNTNELIDMGIPILYFNHLSEMGAIYMPENNIAIKIINKILKTRLGGTIGINKKSDTSSLQHEIQHYRDHADGLLLPMIRFLKGLERKYPDGATLKVSENELIFAYKVILEQRAYAAEIKWLRENYENRVGMITYDSFFHSKRVSYREVARKNIEKSISIFNEIYIEPLVPILKKLQRYHPDIYKGIMNIYKELQIEIPELNLLSLILEEIS